MEIALSSKLKLGFVDGTHLKPEANSPLLLHWTWCNNMVTTWILNSVSIIIRNSVVYMQTALDIWKDLEDIQLAQFLMGLNELYTGIREENQRSLALSSLISHDSVVMAIKNGHTKDKCYCIHGFPPWHKLYGKPKPKPRFNSGTMKPPLAAAQLGLHSANSAMSTLACAIIVNKTLLWHYRLGHVPSPILKLLLVAGLSHDITPCDSCALAKKTRIPFPSSQSQSKSTFELVHIDLWGPYRHKTHTTCTMFLTIVDDKSKATWVYLVSDKAQVPRIFSDFIFFC
ncbi:hypothetical protein AgCh_020747 [Apium graveolens]